MPSFSLASALGASNINAVEYGTFSQGVQRRTANTDPHTQDKVLNDTARLWSTEGHQNNRFRAAVCHCLSLGFAKREIARHIREAAYVEPLNPRDKLYRRIHSRIEYISTNHWKTSEAYERFMMGETSRAVEVLLTNMNKLDLDNNKENTNFNTKKKVTFTAQKPASAKLSERDLEELDLQKDHQKEISSTLAKEGIEEKMLEMKQRILDISHRQSGALFNFPDKPISSEASNAGKRRVKLIIEHPDRAEEYIRMGLRRDPDMGSLRLIQMIDYYCSQ